MRKSTLRVLVSLGFVAVIAGFLWGALLAGVPYQDGTPEQDASFSFHANVAFGVMCLGFSVLVVGLAGFMLQRLRR